jgi:hypothetical protein
LTWGAVTDIDLDGYRVRWQPGGSRSWADALELHTGLLTVSPWDLVTIPYGAGQILIKAVDTTGNESQNVTAVACNLGDAPVENVFASYTLNSDGCYQPGLHHGQPEHHGLRRCHRQWHDHYGIDPGGQWRDGGYLQQQCNSRIAHHSGCQGPGDGDWNGHHFDASLVKHFLQAHDHLRLWHHGRLVQQRND